MESLRDDFKKLTPPEAAAAMRRAAQGANWSIQNAITKFTPEQKEKIHESALRYALKDAIKEKEGSSAAMKDENTR